MGHQRSDRDCNRTSPMSRTTSVGLDREGWSGVGQVGQDRWGDRRAEGHVKQPKPSTTLHHRHQPVGRDVVRPQHVELLEVSGVSGERGEAVVVHVPNRREKQLLEPGASLGQLRYAVLRLDHPAPPEVERGEPRAALGECGDRGVGEGPGPPEVKRLQPLRVGCQRHHQRVPVSHRPVSAVPEVDVLERGAGRGHGEQRVAGGPRVVEVEPPEPRQLGQLGHPGSRELEAVLQVEIGQPRAHPDHGPDALVGHEGAAREAEALELGPGHREKGAEPCLREHTEPTATPRQPERAEVGAPSEHPKEEGVGDPGPVRLQVQRRSPDQHLVGDCKHSPVDPAHAHEIRGAEPLQQQPDQLVRQQVKRSRPFGGQPRVRQPPQQLPRRGRVLRNLERVNLPGAVSLFEFRPPVQQHRVQLSVVLLLRVIQLDPQHVGQERYPS
eukprot:m.196941 g.196941  ORF g.196941 m.196941 type:complete len:440 (+) comp15267_c0_seq2:152-1471(+)